MTYTTLTFNGTEQSLGDWGIGRWRREAFNQASDSFGFDLISLVDAAEIFPFGAMITLKTGRTPAGGSGPTTASGLPVSGCTSWTGGKTWFVGYRVQNVRTGTAWFSYTDNARPGADTAVNGGNVACHPLTIKLKLINQATGPYGFANGGIDFLGVNALGSTFNVGAVNASQ